MTILQSMFLGIVQGLTEFLPISSSGHLVVVPYFLGWGIPSHDAFIFDILVQVATLIGVIAYFWKDLIEIIKSLATGISQKQLFADANARLGWYLILATIPAGILGLMIKDNVKNAFSSPVITAFFLFVTAILLLISERFGKRQLNTDQITWQTALWIGIFQILALFPGISRSGATITGGMIRDLKRVAAARFSFLMSIPIMLAAGFVATLDLINSPEFSILIPSFIPGFMTAAITGYLSIRWLLNYLTHKPLTYFAIYCFLLSLFTFGYSFLIA